MCVTDTVNSVVSGDSKYLTRAPSVVRSLQPVTVDQVSDDVAVVRGDGLSAGGLDTIMQRLVRVRVSIRVNDRFRVRLELS